MLSVNMAYFADQIVVGTWQTEQLGPAWLCQTSGKHQHATQAVA
jgi:hypothetical protein